MLSAQNYFFLNYLQLFLCKQDDPFVNYPKADRSESPAPKPIYRHGARSAQRPAIFACAGSNETNRQRRPPVLTSRGYREAERAGLEGRGALQKKKGA